MFGGLYDSFEANVVASNFAELSQSMFSWTEQCATPEVVSFSDSTWFHPIPSPLTAGNFLKTDNVHYNSTFLNLEYLYPYFVPLITHISVICLKCAAL